ncbi:hypothetical protein [Aquabacterium sp.]|uniref:hypothetical protein n=1 Tax=Aquabacterium sp. TaxID=1872578 RepID=UPI004037DF85
MASPIATVQLAGFTQAGNPATGSGLIGSKAVTLWDDGTLTFTNAAGAPRKIHDNFELNALLAQIIQGASGISPAKKFHN